MGPDSINGCGSVYLPHIHYRQYDQHQQLLPKATGSHSRVDRIQRLLRIVRHLPGVPSGHARTGLPLWQDPDGSGAHGKGRRSKLQALQRVHRRKESRPHQRRLPHSAEAYGSSKVTYFRINSRISPLTTCLRIGEASLLSI